MPISCTASPDADRTLTMLKQAFNGWPAIVGASLDASDPERLHVTEISDLSPLPQLDRGQSHPSR